MSWRAKRSVTSFDTFLNICLKAQFGQQDNTVGHFFNSKADKTCQIATRLSIKSSQSVAVVMARGHLEMDISSKSKKQALTCHRLQLEEGDYYQSGTQLGCCVTLCSVFGTDCPGINKPTDLFVHQFSFLSIKIRV